MGDEAFAKLMWPLVNALCLIVGAIATLMTLPGVLLWGER